MNRLIQMMSNGNPFCCILSSPYIIQYSTDFITRARNAMEQTERIIRIGTSPMTPGEFMIELWPSIQTYCPDIKFQLVPYENTPEIRYAKVVFERYRDKVKYWITFNEINAVVISPRPWHQAGVIYHEDENPADVKLQVGHHQLLASALTVKAGHEINPEFKIGCMLIYHLSYPMTCRPEDQIVSREKMLPQFYFGDVQVRGYYSNAFKRYQEMVGGRFMMESGDEKILQEGKVDFIGFSYYFSTVESTDPTVETVGNVAKGGRNPYLKITKWGWQIDPTGLRTALN